MFLLTNTRYLLIVLSLLLSSCTSIRYITPINGQLVTDKHQPVTVVGSPHVRCSSNNSNKVYTGFFMYYDDDGAVVLNDYGRGKIRLYTNPICILSRDD